MVAGCAGASCAIVFISGWLPAILSAVWAATLGWGILAFRRHRRIIQELDTWLQVTGNLRLTTTVDGDQTIQSVGPGFEQALGWTPQEMVGKPWRWFVHPDDLAPTEQQAELLQAGLMVRQHTNRWRHKNNLPQGKPCWVWLEWSAMSIPGQNLTFASAENMSHRFEREAQMATWSRITTDLMAVADTTVPMERRHFEWLNEAWERQLGWSMSELYAMRIFDLLDPSDLPSIRAHRQKMEAQGTGSATTTCKVRCKPKAGEVQYRTYEWTSVDINGKVYVSGRDIGAEHLHKEQMNQVIRDLEASNADLERFASVAAHQLRSPPRTIAGIAQALREDYGHLLDAEGLQFLEDIRTDADQMAEFVDGLYRFSKVRTSADLDIVPVDLNAVMEEIHNNKVKRGCFASGHKNLTWQDLPIVLGDPVLLNEVLMNLIENGFKFNESATKHVSVSATRRLDGRWDIAVKDNGIGIDPKYHGKLFKMFQRVHPQYAGTGVGLALVGSIVTKMGGTIRVQSTPGEGSVFTFDLPEAWIVEG